MDIVGFSSWSRPMVASRVWNGFKVGSIALRGTPLIPYSTRRGSFWLELYRMSRLLMNVPPVQPSPVMPFAQSIVFQS